MAIKPVEILITAKDKASAVFGSLKATAIAAGVAIAGYFGIRAFSGAIEGAADLEAKLSEVKAVSGATADELQRLRKAAEDAGASPEFAATAEQAADALANLARAGLSVDASISALPPTLQLAQAGQIQLGESAEILTRILAGFGYQADQAGRIADVLAKGADSSNTSVLGLAQALSYAAPTAVSLGLSLETTVAIIGKFADAGIDASRAGTALNAILSQFSDPASKFRQELAAAGIITNNFEDALRQLAAAGPAGQKAVLAVGTEAGPALRALLNQGIGALDDLKAKLDDANGSAAATAATMADNLNGAARGFSSVWDTVKNALATPVLPVLKDGIQQLTGVLRNAVTDGTVGKFGDAIAKGFQAALEWGQRFLAEIDVEALVSRMSSAATSVGEFFDEVREKAQTAGATVQTIWGVMSAGANTVLTAVYAIGEAFARVAQGVMTGVAVLREGLASVTFGGLSAGFKEAAEDARISAGGFGAAADALRAKAVQSLDDLTRGAQAAREGWALLTDSGEEAAAQAETGKAAFNSLSRALQDASGSAEELGAKAGASAASQAKAAQEVQEEIRVLRKEYESALAAGDVQGALTKLNQVKKALRSLSDEASETEQVIKDAFSRMGIQTKADLSQAAENAKRDYEIIKQSGQATAEGLQQAFKSYAEAAIAANGGVASEAIKSEAAMRDLVITTDAAGRSIVQAMNTGAQAVGGLADGFARANQAVQEHMGWLDRLQKRNAEVKSSMVTDSQGFAADAKGNRIVAGGDLTTLTGVANFLKQAGLNDEQAKSVAREFSDGRGNIPYFSNPGQKKYGGEFSTISDALLKAAERVTFGMGGAGGHGVGRTVKVDINTGSGRETVNTDEAGAQAVVRALGVAARRAGR